MVSGGMAGQHYCLRWNNYQSNMTSVFHQLLQNEAFVDVTLACNEASLKAHKVVLSACSSYFQKLLLSNPCKHPTIIMPQDVCFSDLKFIIEFVYRGEIDVSQAELQSLLKTADQLKIKGLCEVPESKDGPPSVSLSSPPREPGSQRFNFTRLKRPYPRYKRTRTSFEPRATDSRHYDRYKEEEDSDSYHRKNKENRRDWQVEDEECTEVAAAAAVVLESCQRNSNNSTNNANGTNNNNNNDLRKHAPRAFVRSCRNRLISLKEKVQKR